MTYVTGNVTQEAGNMSQLAKIIQDKKSIS